MNEQDVILDAAGDSSNAVDENGIANFDRFLQNNRAMQSEFDRRITKALDTAHLKWEQEADQRYRARQAQALAEAKAQTERDFQQREDAVSKREKEIARRELRGSAIEQLAFRGLPAGLADALNYENAESLDKSLNAAEHAFRDAVRQGMEARMVGMQPEAGVQPIRNEDLDDDSYYRTNYHSGGKL